MAGLYFIHIKNSLPDLFPSALLLHLLPRGIKCTVELSSHQHLPVTMSLLWQIKEELSPAPDFLPSDKLMLWWAFTLAFYGFLRSSEFTSPSVSQLLALRPTSSVSPLYVFQSGCHLTRAKVTSILYTLLQHLGIPTELYASHSCRIGAPTSAAEAGLPPWLIQTLRWWSSNCFSINFVFELCPLFSRRFQASWLPQTPQFRGPGTPYKDVALLVFHSQLVHQALFGM